jgi:perosamine synthetase
MEFFHSHITPQAITNAAKVLESGQISEGQKVKEFETELAGRAGLLNPVAVNSGTSALHLGLVLSGVEPGDEVILPAQTFVATGVAILMQRAVPVFADVDPQTGNIAPASILENITPRTKAVIPVHWGGYPCEMDEITAIAARHDLAVIEDAAHALGATYRSRPVGAISRFTAFSFQAIKHLTTGDGGVLCCRDPADAQAALARRWFGIDRANSTTSPLGERQYDLNVLGFKYHMNDLAAGVGLGNLHDFSERLRRRQKTGAYYRDELADVLGLQLLRYDTDRTHAYWLFTLLVERRERFIRKLAEHEIPASVVHLRIDQNTLFHSSRRHLPGQENFDAHQVSIPAHDGLTDAEIEKIVSTVKEGW